MRSLIRPAIRDNNIPIIPNSLALIAVVSSPPMVSGDVMIKHCIHTNKHS